MSARILFITATRLGDAVLSTGVLSHLVAENPDAEITIVCGPLPAPLFRAVPGLKRLVPLEKRRFTQHWIELFLDFFPTKWDVFVDMRNVGILHLIRARRAYRYRNTGEDAHKVMTMRACSASPRCPHRSGSTGAPRPTPTLLGTARGFLAIGPTAGNPHKEWALGRFAELASRLTAPAGALPGAPIAVFAGEADARGWLPFLLRFPPDVSSTSLAGPIPCRPRRASPVPRFMSATIPASCTSPRPWARPPLASLELAAPPSTDHGDRTPPSSRGVGRTPSARPWSSPAIPQSSQRS
ncbi:MAG: hypothetical protein U1E87_09470 [Alphaproteobacteria bacterium]